MLIIGERINTFRKSVRIAFETKNEAFIRKEVIKQAEAGAHIIDINAGSDLSFEPDYMKWAVQIAQEVTDLPLCLDSPNQDTILAGFEVIKNKELTWANSITLEKSRHDKILPLVKEYQCPVIALCQAEGGLSQFAKNRVDAGKKIVDLVDSYGINLENLYLDTMIEPLSVRSDGGLLSMETLIGLKEALPEIKTIISLSGISFGLPSRKLLHRTFMPLLMWAKLDSVFLDPLDKRLMDCIQASKALMAQDEFCMNYIKKHRAGKLGD